MKEKKELEPKINGKNTKNEEKMIEEKDEKIKDDEVDEPMLKQL